jgi:hypothetical protein
MTLSPKVYDLLKWVVQVVLPALATLYAALNGFWGNDAFPEPVAVVGTISAVALFLGAVVGLSGAQYKRTVLQNAGYIDVVGEDPVTGHPDVRLDLTKNPATEGKETVVLKVGSRPE